jgi:hypothetical protein
MSPEKVKSLEQRYEFFRPSAIECENGWYGLIDELCGLLSEHDLKGAKIASLKIKHGGLRVKLSFEEREELEGDVAEVIDYIETKSFMICEVCGGEGHLRERRGAYKTLCEICRLTLTP